MAIRLVSKEFEAKLMPVGAQSSTGKIECKTYGDGERALRARVRDLDGVAPEYLLQLYVNGLHVGDLVRTRDKAELRLDSRQGDTVPAIVADDSAEIRSGELILACGIFDED